MNKNNIKKLTVTAMLTAFAYLVTFLTAMFKVGGFLSLDLKDAVLSIVALLYGPLYGIMSVLCVAIVEFFTFSTTGWYGLLMNLFSSGVFVLVCGTVYKYKRNFKGALISAVLTVLAVTSVMLVANIFITPLYFGMPRATVLDMLLPLLLPFNLCKSVMNSSLMLLVYKPFTSALKKSGLIKSDSAKYEFNKKTAVLTIATVVFIIIALLVLLKIGIKVQ
ncbi:MAG: ECF transporter S component [Clostridia bacterium]|nr:ECF transporter S component [Clostridia bacterium]